MEQSADILLDNLRHTEIYGHGKMFVSDPFMQGAIGMLKLISEQNGWEDSEKLYFEQFIIQYNSILGNQK